MSLAKCEAAALVDYRRATKASSIQNTKWGRRELRLVLEAVSCEGLVVIRDVPVSSYIELVWIEGLVSVEDVVVISLARNAKVRLGKCCKQLRGNSIQLRWA